MRTEEREISQEEKEKALEYQELIKKSDKTSRIEIMIPNIEEMSKISDIYPSTSVKIRSNVAGALAVLSMESAIDEIIKAHPEIKKMIKYIRKNAKIVSQKIEGSN